MTLLNKLLTLLCTVGFVQLSTPSAASFAKITGSDETGTGSAAMAAVAETGSKATLKLSKEETAKALSAEFGSPFNSSSYLAVPGELKFTSENSRMPKVCIYTDPTILEDSNSALMLTRSDFYNSGSKIVYHITTTAEGNEYLVTFDHDNESVIIKLKATKKMITKGKGFDAIKTWILSGSAYTYTINN